MKYTIRFAPTAISQFTKLSRGIQIKVRDALHLLADNPYPSGCVLLQSNHTFRRIFVDDYRVIYQVKKRELIILIVRKRLEKKYIRISGE